MKAIKIAGNKSWDHCVMVILKRLIEKQSWFTGYINIHPDSPSAFGIYHNEPDYMEILFKHKEVPIYIYVNWDSKYSRFTIKVSNRMWGSKQYSVYSVSAEMKRPSYSNDYQKALCRIKRHIEMFVPMANDLAAVKEKETQKLDAKLQRIAFIQNHVGVHLEEQYNGLTYRQTNDFGLTFRPVNCNGETKYALRAMNGIVNADELKQIITVLGTLPSAVAAKLIGEDVEWEDFL